MVIMQFETLLVIYNNLEIHVDNKIQFNFINVLLPIVHCDELITKDI